MENRWSRPADESGAHGRCRPGRRSDIGGGGSLENRRRHSRSVSSRSPAGAERSQRSEVGSHKSAISRLRASLRRAGGSQRSEIEEQGAESEHFGRNISNLFSRVLPIPLPLVAEYRPDSHRRTRDRTSDRLSQRPQRSR